MATTYPNLDEELRKSTEAQRAAFAAKPVVPAGAPSGARSVTGPITAARATPYQNLDEGVRASTEALRQFSAANPVVPSGNRSVAGTITPATSPIEYNTTAGNAVPADIIRRLDQINRAPRTPAPVVAGPAMATRPTVQPSFTKVSDRQADTYGPGQVNGPGISVSVPQATIDQVGQQPLPLVEHAAQNMNPNDPFGGLGERAYRAGMQAQLDQYAAREREGQLFKMQAMQNHLSEVQARTNKEKADEDLRFATFAAKHGADMVLRGGTKSQKKAILADQARAAGAAAAASDAHLKTLGAFPTAGADPVKNAILAGELGNRRAQTEQEGLKTIAGLGVASAKMRGEQAQAGAEAEKLKQAKSFSALSSILSDPKSSDKDRSAAQKSLLAMLGKNQMAGRMVPFKIPAEVDKFGNPVGEAEDAFMFLGEDGSREVVRASDLIKRKEKK